MPLSMVSAGEAQKIIRVGGKSETKHFLETLGFVPGGDVTVISKNAGNMIVNVKESRVAISQELANKIIV